MKIIERYVDELLDYFPVNRMTRTIRMDLLQAAAKDYHHLLDEGTDQKEASRQIIEHIEGPEVLAEMIPDRNSIFYYILTAISLGVCFIIYQYISEPDFLQIFLPARMVFPDIVEHLILYLMALYIFYIVLCQLIRKLPQKLLNRTMWQSMLFLYGGTIMTALYFSISIDFMWFSFNGYADDEMLNGGFMLRFQFNFYKSLIEPTSMIYVYGFINALCFVLSKQYYHLSLHPAPYHLDDIYHPLTFSKTDSQDEKGLAEAMTPVAMTEAISQLTGDLAAIIDQKASELQADENKAEIKENETSEAVSEITADLQEASPSIEDESRDQSETADKVLDDSEPSKAMNDQPDSDPVPVPVPAQKTPVRKKKKNKNRKPVIQLANDRYKKKA